jgi:hypothetical protein
MQASVEDEELWQIIDVDDLAHRPDGSHTDAVFGIQPFVG